MNTIILFATSSAAYQAEKQMKKAGLSAQLIRTPRQLGRSCTLSVKVPAEQRTLAAQTLAQVGLRPTGMHTV